MKRELLRGREQPWEHQRLRLLRCLTLLVSVLFCAQAQAQQGPIVPGYDKLGQLEQMLGPIEAPCEGPRLIAASNPFSFLYKQSEGSAARAELRLRGSLGLCMRNFVVGFYGQYSDVERGNKLVPGYDNDGNEILRPWWESRDLYLALQVGVRTIFPSKGMLNHEGLLLLRGQVFEERDYRVGCENGQCPWFASLMPMYRLRVGIFRFSVGASLDRVQTLTDWFEKAVVHPEHGFGTQYFAVSANARAGLRFGDEDGLATLDVFGEGGATLPLVKQAGQAGRAYGVGARLDAPLIRPNGGGASVNLQLQATWKQHYVPEVECNTPLRAGTSCFYRGIVVGPMLVVGFGYPGYALDPAERVPPVEEQAAPEPPTPVVDPEPDPPSPAKIPAVEALQPAPPPPAPKICKMVFDPNDRVLRASVSSTSHCGPRTKIEYADGDDPKAPLSVIACRRHLNAEDEITHLTTGNTLNCEEILMRQSTRH